METATSDANRHAIPVAMETPAATDLAVPKDPNTKSRNPSARVNTHTEPASVEYRAGTFIAVKPIANAMERAPINISSCEACIGGGIWCFSPVPPDAF